MTPLPRIFNYFFSASILLFFINTNICTSAIKCGGQSNDTSGVLVVPENFRGKNEGTCNVTLTNMTGDGILLFKKLILDDASLSIYVNGTTEYSFLNNSLLANTILLVHTTSDVNFEFQKSNESLIDFEIVYSFDKVLPLALDGSVSKIIIRKGLLVDASKAVATPITFTLEKKADVGHVVSVSCNTKVKSQLFSDSEDLSIRDHISASETLKLNGKIDYKSFESDVSCIFGIQDKDCSGKVTLDNKHLFEKMSTLNATSNDATDFMSCLWLLHSETNISLIFNETRLPTDLDSYSIRSGQKIDSPIFVVLYKSNLKSSIKDERLSVTGSRDLIISYRGSKSGDISTIYAVISNNTGHYVNNGKFSLVPADLPLITPKYLFQASNISGTQAVANITKSEKPLGGTIFVYNRFIASPENLIAKFDAGLDSLPQYIGSDTSQLMIILDGKDSHFEGEFFSSQMLYSVARGGADSFVLDDSSLKTDCLRSAQWVIPRQPPGKIVILTISRLVLGPGYTLTVSGERGNMFKITGAQSSTASDAFAFSLPQLILNDNTSHLLTYKKGEKDCNSSAKHLLEAFNVVADSFDSPSASSIHMTSDQEYIITSDNYPSNFSLVEPTNNTAFRLVNSSKPLIYWQLGDLDLTSRQSLSVASPNSELKFDETVPPTDHGDRMTICDKSEICNAVIFFDRPYNNEFSTSDRITGRGFKFVARPLDCGKEITSDHEFVLNPANTSSDCMYIINPQERRSATHFINFTMTDYPNNVDIYDSNTIRDGRKVNASYLVNGTLLSSVSSIIVHWKYSKDQKPITLSWRLQDCKTPCGNRERCMLEHWKCNEVNDCGDNSDEIHCNDTIVEEISTGVNGYVCVFLIIPLAAVVGAIMAIYGPQVLRRVGGDRYQEFQNLDAT